MPLDTARQSIFVLFLFLTANVTGVYAGTSILDNGKAGTSSTGKWVVSKAAKPYRKNSLESSQGGAKYTFNVNLDAPGKYKVLAWWTHKSNRRSSVPYDIKHNGGTRTVTVNQKLNGGKWNKLGTWTFGRTAAITIRSRGGGVTSADAIKLVPVTDATTSASGNVAPVLKNIGNQSIGIWKTLNFNISATDNDGTTPILIAKKLPPNASFIDYGNGTGAFSWSTTSEDKGAHNITFVAKDATNRKLADRITTTVSVVDDTVSAASSSTPILDNGDAGAAPSGPWRVSSGARPYGSNSLETGQKGASYTYNINLKTAGEYRVFAWWTNTANRRTYVPYEINHANGTETLRVNQKKNVGKWNQLGDSWRFGKKASITIRSLGGGTTCADAILLVPVAEASAGGDAPVAANSTGVIFHHDFNSEALHTYGAADMRTTWKARAGGIQPNAVKIVEDPHSSKAHGKVMRVFYAGNSVITQNNSGSQWRTRLGGTHNELYLAYDVFFTGNAEFVLGGKLPGLMGGPAVPVGGAVPDGTDGWTGRLAWKNAGKLLNYMYVANNPGNYGWEMLWNDGLQAQAYMTKGAWNRLEIRYVMNQPGIANGIVEAWLNGKRVLNFRKILFRAKGASNIGIDELFFSTFYGGSAAKFAPANDQYIYFDNFVVSKQPITH